MYLPSSFSLLSTPSSKQTFSLEDDAMSQSSQGSMGVLVTAFQRLSISDLPASRALEDAAVDDLVLAFSAMAISHSTSWDGDDDITVVEEDEEGRCKVCDFDEEAESPDLASSSATRVEHLTPPSHCFSSDSLAFESPLIIVEPPPSDLAIDHLFSPNPSPCLTRSVRRPSFTYTLPRIHISISPSPSMEAPSPTHFQTTFGLFADVFPELSATASMDYASDTANIALQNYATGLSKPFDLPAFTLPKPFVLFNGQGLTA
ncbi:hypothetical protein FA95DRAFT_1179799 [Auriscalpium vulgare]|uniref:Uncharacterized protein n=1 Tax=Auriscalpium vulgare TaxID=40419 RepID=A0ACB8SAB6_9AGAM|nr:hypothetical protein FA95DRAFT_1179799 [Auriscalpium vulgare]